MSKIKQYVENLVVKCNHCGCKKLYLDTCSCIEKKSYLEINAMSSIKKRLKNERRKL